MWSYLLSGIGVSGLFLAKTHPIVGFLIGMLAQVLWIAYALITGQFGFIVSAVAYAFVYARLLWGAITS